MSSTQTQTNPYPRIKAYERQGFERLTRYLEALEPDGWTEQSYCADWRVFQVVSHIASGSRIGGMRVRAWAAGAEPPSREAMQQVWGFFDSLGPDRMLDAYRAAVDEYLTVEAETPDEAGLREVDGFSGRRPLYGYQLARVWELACHSWDVYVARDRQARLDPVAAELVGSNLQFTGGLPLDKQRAAALTTRPIGLRLENSGASYTLDPAAERPRAEPGETSAAPLVVEGPDEEIIRLLAGRHLVPGSRPALRVTRGSEQDLAAFKRALR